MLMGGTRGRTRAVGSKDMVSTGLMFGGLLGLRRLDGGRRIVVDLVGGSRCGWCGMRRQRVCFS